MNRLIRTACIGVIVLAALASQARAGRIGGPMADSGTIAPGQSFYFDVPFAAGSPAEVSVVGQGQGNVELYVSDSQGHVTQGVGAFERRRAVFPVYRSGFFRVELRNTGNVPARVIVATN